MKAQHIQTLREIVGIDNLCTDLAHLSAYSFDSTRLEKLPSCVIFPQNEEQIAQILCYANTHQIPITPRGAGSGMSGGSLNTGVILALQKHLNQILHIDRENLSVKVQPGVINAKLNETLAPLGLFFPPDPASQTFSTLGGNVAENAGGMSAVKYGVTKDYVLGMRVVLSNGEILTLGHNTLKDVAGYHLLGLMCGSEGTLGIITELTLKLRPLPKYTQSLLIGFASLQDLANASCAILSNGITPCAMEFLDHPIIQALNQKHQLYPQNTQAILILKLDSNFQETIRQEKEEILKILNLYSPLCIQIAQTPQEEHKIWFGRKNASQACSSYGIKKLNEDITIPRSEVAGFLHFRDKIAQKYGFTIPCFGHIGDGNIHTNVMLKNLEDLDQGYEAVKELFVYALSVGGTLSGEHGIGISKASFMPLAFSQAHLELFRNIKKAFDPNNILNPHKMGL